MLNQREIIHTEIGDGQVTSPPGEWQLHIPAASGAIYHDAQISDYSLQKRNFQWHAPSPGQMIRLRLKARFSHHDVQGTAGFGFWNHPFSPDMRGLPRPPQAAWFFYGSPPNHMPLAINVPGHGWKAATLNARRPQFWALAPFALPGFVLMRIPALYRSLWPVGQAALAVREHALPLESMTEQHIYTIDWRADGLRFWVDETVVLTSPYRIGGRMGFIAWIDNQYAVVTPQGRFAWGLVAVPQPQILWLQDLTITREAL